ncbi:MAG: Gfo/Idh/MocA family oxidoreductase, partial [Verrucomicrobiae bacterium]|nr:Gfo/Idh/MocA family oxidoreductase [Verrucomicrobiae bacterium]
MIRIGIVGCGRILAAHLRGYRLLREAGVDDFQITALCARREEDALGYVKRGEGPAQRRAVSTIPGDPLAIGDEYLSDFQPGVEVAVYTDYERMIAEGPIDAVNDFTIHSLHHRIAEIAFRHGKHLMSQKPLAVTMEAARRMCDQAEAAGVSFGVFENARFRRDVRLAAWALSEEGPAG